MSSQILLMLIVALPVLVVGLFFVYKKFASSKTESKFSGSVEEFVETSSSGVDSHMDVDVEELARVLELDRSNESTEKWKPVFDDEVPSHAKAVKSKDDERQEALEKKLKPLREKIAAARASFDEARSQQIKLEDHVKELEKIAAQNMDKNSVREADRARTRLQRNHVKLQQEQKKLTVLLESEARMLGVDLDAGKDENTETVRPAFDPPQSSFATVGISDEDFSQALDDEPESEPEPVETKPGLDAVVGRVEREFDYRNHDLPEDLPVRFNRSADRDEEDK